MLPGDEGLTVIVDAACGKIKAPRYARGAFMGNCDLRL